jgi:hypothetical protein
MRANGYDPFINPEGYSDGIDKILDRNSNLSRRTDTGISNEDQADFLDRTTSSLYRWAMENWGELNDREQSELLSEAERTREAVELLEENTDYEFRRTRHVLGELRTKTTEPRYIH